MRAAADPRACPETGPGPSHWPPVCQDPCTLRRRKVLARTKMAPPPTRRPPKMRRGARAPAPPQDPHARRLAAQDPPLARQPASAPQLPPVEVARPRRAGGMLPVPVVPGAELAAATARALAAAYGLDGHTAPSYDDEDARDDSPTLPATAKTPRM
ncbi:hypothetical protein PF008_g23524 [Phytophthora fragariae]|uniref:Uncharacterized protein n=1 Tax=Phytophthora fragariae TaxID=53985 RepID=A0A6G0QRG1_9STRA|nr:hypothetical protein PF008_g23524 [Phytophthora fragariae]